MSDDKNLDLPSIKPAQDEVSSYRRSTRSDAPRQSNFNGILVFVIVIMAIMMGVGGFTLYEVQKKLDQSNVLLAKGQENVLELENRLAATGTDVSKTLQTMQAQMQTNVAEIDKLWAVAYRQNRPNIQKLEKSLSETQAKLTPLDARINTIQTEFQSMATDMAQERQGLMDDKEEMATSVSLVRGQIQDQSVQVEGNRRNVSVLTSQMKDVEEAIESNDRFRQQLNQRLLDMQGQIQTITEPAGE